MAKKMFGKIAIIGTGFMGGSIGLEIRNKKLCDTVIGISLHPKSVARAKKIKAIDTGSTKINILDDADLVIFATPVSVTLKLAPRIAKVIKKSCIVTDVGSTKQDIVCGLEPIFPNFIGSHPLAGSEKRGVLNAKQGIFRNSLVILTPGERTPASSCKAVKRFWLALGTRVLLLSPSLHDKILSYVSHLPHAAAFSLINTIPQRFAGFGAGGLRDTTRIAASDPGIWTDILITNRGNLLWHIKEFEAQLKRIKTALKNSDRGALFEVLQKAQARRLELERSAIIT